MPRRAAIEENQRATMNRTWSAETIHPLTQDEMRLLGLLVTSTPNAMQRTI